jgi:hypothetical protein
VLKEVQGVSATIRELPILTRPLPLPYSVIEEIVEGFAPVNDQSLDDEERHSALVGSA